MGGFAAQSNGYSYVPLRVETMPEGARVFAVVGSAGGGPVRRVRMYGMALWQVVDGGGLPVAEFWQPVRSAALPMPVTLGRRFIGFTGRIPQM